jgi:hypothetical protein
MSTRDFMPDLNRLVAVAGVRLDDPRGEHRTQP